MLFRKRARRPIDTAHSRHVYAHSRGGSGFYSIEFEMMTKGAIIRRRGKLYRQYGVTVGGSTRLVTSGDVVDQATYEALLAAGALNVPRPEPSAEPAPDPGWETASTPPTAPPEE